MAVLERLVPRLEELARSTEGDTMQRAFWALLDVAQRGGVSARTAASVALARLTQTPSTLNLQTPDLRTNAQREAVTGGVRSVVQHTLSIETTLLAHLTRRYPGTEGESRRFAKLAEFEALLPCSEKPWYMALIELDLLDGELHRRIPSETHVAPEIYRQLGLLPGETPSVHPSQLGSFIEHLVTWYPAYASLTTGRRGFSPEQYVAAAINTPPEGIDSFTDQPPAITGDSMSPAARYFAEKREIIASGEPVPLDFLPESLRSAAAAIPREDLATLRLINERVMSQDGSQERSVASWLEQKMPESGKTLAELVPMLVDTYEISLKPSIPQESADEVQVDINPQIEPWDPAALVDAAINSR